MISEHRFAASYPSIWSRVAPLSDGYWHFENMLVTRETPPLNTRAPKTLRGVVNEAAFGAFCALRATGGTFDRSRVLSVVDAVTSEALVYVQRLSPRATFQLQAFDDTCRREAVALTLRFLHFFPDFLPTRLRPAFPGCGLISPCEGDVIEGDCLYEIKAGNRAFRIIDLRQLLIYSALSYSAGSLAFTTIGLFNPRIGVSWSRTLDQVCHSIAGTHAVDTLSTLGEHFSAVSASR